MKSCNLSDCIDLKVGDVVYFSGPKFDELWTATYISPQPFNSVHLTCTDMMRLHSYTSPLGLTIAVGEFRHWQGEFTIIGNVYNTTTDINSIETNKCKCDLYALMNIGCKCGGR